MTNALLFYLSAYINPVNTLQLLSLIYQEKEDIKKHEAVVPMIVMCI